LDLSLLFGGAITIVVALIGGVAYGVGSKNKGDFNTQEIEGMKTHINTLYGRTNVHSVNIGKIETAINGMHEDITEIKDDVKELLRGS